MLHQRFSSESASDGLRDVLRLGNSLKFNKGLIREITNNYLIAIVTRKDACEKPVKEGDNVEYGKVTVDVVEALKAIFGADDVLTDKAKLEVYSHDESTIPPHLPDVVVKPESTHEVAMALKLANEKRIPVVARSCGTCVTGGTVPIHGGIVISFEKMNRILEIDEENLLVTVEPGVVIMDLHAEMEKRGYLYPPDPAQKGSCLGGNINTNAGGMTGVKYGVTRDFVEALEVVLATGEVIHLGRKTVKNSTGYSLKDLIIGSEGTLGVTTKMILRLVPLPKILTTLYVPFNNFQDAAKTVAEIIRNKIVPLALEFADQPSILVAERFLGRPMPHNSAPAYLIIRLDGNLREEVDASYEAVGEICLEHGAIDVLVADTSESQEKVWEGRSCIIDAAKAEGVVELLDAVVPRNRLPDFLEGLNALARRIGIHVQNFGHAGDGNVHTNILKEDLSDEEWNAKVQNFCADAYRLSLSLGGNISAEHGIGLVRKQFLPLALGANERDSAVQIDLMRKIKTIFDPHNILNPDKIFTL
jgi:glycolate oxidase